MTKKTGHPEKSEQESQGRDPEPSKETPASSEEGNHYVLFAGGKFALIGGVVTAAIAIGAQLMVGLVYADAQAQAFLNTLIPATRSLASSIVTASATILALMLTIIGITSGDSKRLEPRFYQQVRNIARFDTIALAGSLLLLLLFNFPIEEQQALPATWLDVLYYALLVLVAGITGLFVGTILMLYEAVVDLIIVHNPERESSLVIEREDVKQSEENKPGQH